VVLAIANDAASAARSWPPFVVISLFLGSDI